MSMDELQIGASTPKELTEPTNPEQRASDPRKEGMTVKQAIEYLSKLPDKEMALMVDCPNCGHGHQLARIVEAVIMEGVQSE